MLSLDALSRVGGPRAGHRGHGASVGVLVLAAGPAKSGLRFAMRERQLATAGQERVDETEGVWEGDVVRAVARPRFTVVERLAECES